MKNMIIFGVLLILAGLAATIATAASGNCYAIRDNSLRQQCLAETQRNEAYCYGMRNSDEKNKCLAKVSGNRAYCYSIRSADEKAYCLAR